MRSPDDLAEQMAYHVMRNSGTLSKSAGTRMRWEVAFLPAAREITALEQKLDYHAEILRAINGSGSLIAACLTGIPIIPVTSRNV
jgi:hypothetical protein